MFGLPGKKNDGAYFDEKPGHAGIEYSTVVITNSGRKKQPNEPVNLDSDEFLCSSPGRPFQPIRRQWLGVLFD